MTKLSLGIAICLAACSSHAPHATSPRIADPVPMTERTTQAVPLLVAYERVRALLAADSIDGLAPAAHEIETSARSAELARAAGTLAAATTIDDARLAFGEVSKQLIAVLANDPALAQGQHVFACPMVTTGYNKWVQPTDDLQNPYMGKRMLACGGESDWQ